jgi:protein O-GlcNAc transferase
VHETAMTVAVSLHGRRALAAQHGLTPRSLCHLAERYRRAGDLPNAIACYSAAVALMPGFAAAHSNLAAALKECGYVVQALGHYLDAIRLDPTFAE